MIIEVNRVACEGHGLCEQTAPEIFGLDEDGYATVLVEKITPDIQAAAEAGANVCPVAALLVRR
ncbi:MAG TPA: ferredoxin [Trebonia sp.]|jgi:ferredoxin|nr:ferredoxin [Trebonia sp.]